MNDGRSTENPPKCMDIYNHSGDHVFIFYSSVTAGFYVDDANLLSWITLHTNKMEESFEFYTKIIGLNVTSRFSPA